MSVRVMGAMTSDGSSLPVLVIDDNAVVCQLITETLGEVGYTVETSSDGAGTLTEYKPGTYQLLLVDIILPRMGGVEIARAVRGKGDDTPIILISGYRPEKARVAMDELSSIGFLKKPFTSVELIASVRTALSASDRTSE